MSYITPKLLTHRHCELIKAYFKLLSLWKFVRATVKKKKKKVKLYKAPIIKIVQEVKLLLKQMEI